MTLRERLAEALHDEWDRRVGEVSEPGAACPECRSTADALLSREPLAGLAAAAEARSLALADARRAVEALDRYPGHVMRPPDSRVWVDRAAVLSALDRLSGAAPREGEG